MTHFLHTPAATRGTAHRAVRRTMFAVAALTLFAQGVTIPGAFAQQMPPPASAEQAVDFGQNAAQNPTQNASQNVDPPGRVARLNYMAGTVTTEPAGATDWSYAQINRPLTTGDQLWDDKGARAELHIGSTAVRLGESTSLDVLNLDDSNAQLKVVQGTLSAHVRELPQGGSYEIDTPNLALGIGGPGDYRVDVAPDGSSTTVTVRSGSATVYGDNGQLPIAAGQQIRFAGTALQQVASNGAPGPDSFDTWAASRDAAEDRSVSARYVSRDVPGYEDLDANGTWRSNPQYGDVWVPNSVPAGWAPYHDGHWVWQAPWGWTWVDDAPWGFAPYHYGRWAYVDDSWAWVPGPMVASEPPVYAPALVGFVGGGDSQFSWGVNLAIGGAFAAGVAWFPLGPGEAWHPRWGGWSPRYYDRVNDTVVVNRYNHVDVHNTYINYRAPGGVTAVPATAFVHGQPVNRFNQKVDPRQWHNARLQSGAPNIAPVRESFGPGVRNANYRPPASAAARPVIATRGPAMPPAYRDNLAQRFAQGGGRVPGAGDPIVRTTVPAHFAGVAQANAGRAGGAPVPNVRVVQSHSAGGAPGIAAGGPIQRGAAPAGARPEGQMAGNGVPRAGMPGRPDAAPTQTQRGGPAPGQPQTQAGGEHPQAGNGVPRPPQFVARPGNQIPAGTAPGAPGGAQGAPARQAENTSRGEPSWTQPHQPIAQQRAPGQPMTPQAQTPQQAPHNTAEARPPQSGQPQGRPDNPAIAQASRAPSPSPEAPRAPQQAQPSHQPQFARAPQGGPQQERPQQAQAPRPQPAEQPHPPQQARAEPQRAPQEVHAQAPQPRPQPQPRPEFHPQPQPQQVHEQVHEQPRPQPQQHEQPHPQASDNHNHGERPHG